MVAKCKEENCNKSPAFNYINEKERLYCKEHKKGNMVDIKTKKCLFKDCKKQPSCNFENESKAIYCFEHKKENIIPSLTTFGFAKAHAEGIHLKIDFNNFLVIF